MKVPDAVPCDWLLSSDNAECEVREVCESSEALLAHSFNVHELIKMLFDRYATDHTIAICGDPSHEILQRAAAMSVKMKTHFFLRGFS